jgi:hypothetical protein
LCSRTDQLLLQTILASRTPPEFFRMRLFKSTASSDASGRSTP